MKALILAGGVGTRLSEETTVRPKPLVEIGGKPIIWHIMSIFASQGFTDFVIACGYKGEMLKEYFLNFHLHNADLTVNLGSGKSELKNQKSPDWNIAVVDTGDKTQTGGRVKRLHSWINNETFFLTYGDGVGNINIQALLDFHRSHGKMATVTAVHPPARFGRLSFKGDQVIEFSEKPQTDGGWINGGFMVLEPKVLEYIEGDETLMEREPMARLAKEGQLMAYRHEGFWQPMDTLREKHLLEEMWQSGKAPWIKS
ncbi:MAG: glucose-1-phosphate cytidylyltransferase [bacterium]|nr:glucose-1-phosphate cytidylyltransferase [bacterium]